MIDAELDTQAHHIAAKALVTFTAPENAEMVSFGFHPALKVTKITDDAGKLLTGERSADGTIRVAPSTPFAKGQSYHWTFEYEGIITGNEDGPVEGLKLAAIQEPITYLLYAARWFPTAGYMTDRFTAEMHIKVPQGMRVFASGSTGPSKPATLAGGKPGDEYDFNWKPSIALNCARMICRRTWRPGVMSILRRVGNRRIDQRWPSGRCNRCSRIPQLRRSELLRRGPRCKRISDRSIKIFPGRILWSRQSCARGPEKKVRPPRLLFLAVHW